MNDKASYAFSLGGGVSRRGTITRTLADSTGDIRDKFRYRLIDDSLLLPFGHHLSSAAADIIDVFSAIAMCDRLAPRSYGRTDSRSGLGVGRSIAVAIPVRDDELWNRPEICDSVVGLAEMLTGDRWSIGFSRRGHEPRRGESQLSLRPDFISQDTVVALHSGGLDSLLGMAEVLAADEYDSLIPVSLLTNGKTKCVIDGVITSLLEINPRAITQSAQMTLMTYRIDQRINDRESEFRTRILPCLAAGIAVAIEFGAGRLQLTENGPGAINLPASLEQVESWATRATHPQTLAAVARLATQVLDREMRIENTGLFKTKGLLAEVLQDSRFENAARHTVSCDRFPYANADAPCGMCMSCLYRQAALHRVGMIHIDAERHARRQEKLTVASGQRLLIETSALAMQVAQLRSLLVSTDPYRELDAEYGRIDDVLSVAAYLGMTEDEVKRGLVDLYGGFVEEVEAFLHANLVTFPHSEAHAVAS